MYYYYSLQLGMFTQDTAALFKLEASSLIKVQNGDRLIQLISYLPHKAHLTFECLVQEGLSAASLCFSVAVRDTVSLNAS